MALSWPLTVLVTALLALLCSMCIFTEYEYTLRVPVKTTAEHAFRFMSDPMLFKDLHTPVISLTILSQHQIQDPPGKYLDMTGVEILPVLGEHTFHNQVWYNTQARRINITAQLLWGLMTANVTWTVVSDGGPDAVGCHLEERAVTTIPWILSSVAKSIQEETHRELLQTAQRTIEKLSRNPEEKPGF